MKIRDVKELCQNVFTPPPKEYGKLCRHLLCNSTDHGTCLKSWGQDNFNEQVKNGIQHKVGITRILKYILSKSTCTITDSSGHAHVTMRFRAFRIYLFLEMLGLG